MAILLGIYLIWELTFCHGKIHHAIHGKITSYFDWAMFNCKVLVHQRVNMAVSENRLNPQTQWLMIIIPFLNGYFLGIYLIWELTFCHGKIHHAIHGKITSYFDWAMFNCKVLVHQRVNMAVSENRLNP